MMWVLVQYDEKLWWVREIDSLVEHDGHDGEYALFDGNLVRWDHPHCVWTILEDARPNMNERRESPAEDRG